jgi:hypothetical protein
VGPSCGSKELTQKLITDLEAARAVEERRTWEIITQMENALMSLGFSPIRTGDVLRTAETTCPSVECRCGEAFTGLCNGG